MCGEFQGDQRKTWFEDGEELDSLCYGTDLLEEAGEVASVVKGLEGLKPPEKLKTREMLAAELSDLLYIVFVLAGHYGVELEKPFLETVNGYLSRFTK